MRLFVIVLITTMSCTSLFGQVAFDTITNWQLFKGSELLIKSNLVETQHGFTIINNETKYEDLNFQIFYDYFLDTLNRKIVFTYEDSIIASYEDKNQSHSKFIIQKTSIEKDLKKYLNKILEVEYFDKFNPSGLVVGTLMFVKTPYDILQINEIENVLQLALDLPELQQYFHFPEKTSRKPLKMLEHGIINSSNLHGINKFGLPVVFVNKKQIKNSKYHISIGDWTAVNGELRVQLFYPIEGIIINYMFEKVNGQWEIKDFIIVEE